MKDSLQRALQVYTNLPAQSALPELTTALARGHAILSAPTGSGKTTLVPLALLAMGLLPAGSKILMLEPRRIAARAAACRMSQMIGEQVGKTIGYRTRLDTRVSGSTRIEVITEGVLIRQLQAEPDLANVSLVIFDEFHERSIQADLGLALCLDLCQLRDDLRLLVMSATLEDQPISELLYGAPHITASGRSYPVTIQHLSPPANTTNLAPLMESGIKRAWHDQQGDILAFFPGEADIHKCSTLLATSLPHALVLPLYGNLSQREQDRIFTRNSDARRIILATPIAETSITVEGIGAVVDSGYYRRPVHDATSGLSRLTTMRISKSSATQRAGRAGRTGPGICYRMWGMDVEAGLLPNTPPEIVTGDLLPVVLELALWGVNDPAELRWLDCPRTSTWNGAVALLIQLGLLDRDGRISEAGRAVAALPVHPRLGIILQKGSQLGCPWTACLLAAILSDRDILSRKENNADLEERVRLLHDFSAGATHARRILNTGLCNRLIRQADAWLKNLRSTREKRPPLAEVGNLIAHGYPDWIAQQRDGTRNTYHLASGIGAQLDDADTLTGHKLLAIARMDNRERNGRIFLAAPLARASLAMHHSYLLREVAEVKWDSRKQRVISTSEVRLGSIVLDSKPLERADAEEILAALLTGIKMAGSNCLPFTREARELQARLDSLHHWYPDQWPPMDDTTLLADLDWLSPFCRGMKNLKNLANLDLKTILLSRFDWDKQQQLERLAPSHYRVPSGSKLRLTYTAGEQPVLAARVQELFGQTRTPTICNGQIGIIIHLLSPARRPVQITSDLHSFWTNSYPEVRKELAGRYPKHFWPTDPLTAVATAKTKKQMDRSSQ